MFNVRFRGYDIILIVLFIGSFIRGIQLNDLAISLITMLGLLIYVCKLLIIMDHKKQYKKEVLKHGKRS